MRCALLLILMLMACRQGDAQPAPALTRDVQGATVQDAAIVDARVPAPDAADHDLAVPWTGTPPPAHSVVASPTHFVLGDDVYWAMRTARGWLGARSSKDKADVHELVDERGVIATGKSDLVVAAEHTIYVLRGSLSGSRKVYRLASRKLVPITGSVKFDWAFDFGDHVIGIENYSSTSSAPDQWRTVMIEADKAVVVETSPGDYAKGAARLHNEIIVTAREHDQSTIATVEDKVAAIRTAAHGNGAALAGIVGQPRGWLLHFDSRGRLQRRELLAAQTPDAIAVTRDGWLVVATEGTAAHGFRDAVLLARAPRSSELRLLLRDLQFVSSLEQAGSWVCLYEMVGESRVVHCIDPGRALHVVSQPLAGEMVTLFGIELAPKPRLLLHRTWHPDGHGRPAIDEVLELALP